MQVFDVLSHCKHRAHLGEIPAKDRRQDRRALAILEPGHYYQGPCIYSLCFRKLICKLDVTIVLSHRGFAGYEIS